MVLYVAQQRHELHGLAGPVDAALGIEKGIRRAGRGAALDAPVAQIEGRPGQVEHVVIVLAKGHQRRRFAAARAAQQARIKARIALAIGDHFA